MKERTIPAEVSYNVPSFDIIINETVVDPGYQIVSITVVKEVNKIPSAKIVLRDGNATEESFPISENEEFLPGKPIIIQMGRDSKNEPLFKGVIVNHGIRIRENGTAHLVLDCRDECVKMTFGRQNYYYEEVKDSDVLEEIIGRHQGLTADVEPTTLKHLGMVQHHATDWDFMMMRAEVNGKIVVVNDGTVSIKSPETSGEAAVSVLYGSTLIDFDAEMDARTQWAAVEAKSWDYGGQAIFDHRIDEVNISEPGNVSGKELADRIGFKTLNLRHSGQILEEELQEWTKATLQKSRLAKIRGRAKFTGFSDIIPGQMIELQGVGERFNGKAFVSAVRQDIYNGSWYTQVQFGLDPECFSSKNKDITSLPASGVLPAIQGLQVGKVVQLQDDPNGENRILVRLPIIDNDANGVWARIATLDAGKNRGSFFLPEIDDEVVLGFLNNDPREAIVVGMLNSSAHPAPIEATDDNHEKAFVTRSSMRIHFNDDTKTITIDTPAGNVIKLDEDSTSITIEDQNGNSTVMNDSGIEMKSAGDIKIEATGNIDIVAGSEMNLEGVKIALAAKSSLEMEGATTKLSGKGITEVSGSLVKIN